MKVSQINNFILNNKIKTYKTQPNFMGENNNKNKIPKTSAKVPPNYYDNIKKDFDISNDRTKAEAIDTQGPSTKLLNDVISSAIPEITPFKPLIIANTDKLKTVNYLNTMLSNNYIENSIFVKDIMMIEDPRLEKDKPIVLSRTENGDLLINGDDIEIYNSNHEMKTTLYRNYAEPLDFGDSISLKSQGLMSIHINCKNPNPYLFKKYVNKYSIDKFLDYKLESPEEIKEKSRKVALSTGLHPVFEDVGGNKKAIEEIEENILFPMVYPEAFGHIMNKGMILAGPPGTGKTLLAQALANEVKRQVNKDVTFYSIPGTSLTTAEVGKTEENWRELFKKASEHQPSIIFIDELESVSQNRDSSSNARFDNKTVNQLLTLFSDLEKSDDAVFVISATNKPEILDSAITRDGRLGKIIEVPAPDESDCLDILQKLLKGKRIDYSFDMPYFAKQLNKIDATGATISGIIGNAEKISMKRVGIFDKMRRREFLPSDMAKVVITNEDFEQAIKEKQEKDKILKNKTNIKHIGFNEH